MSLSATEMEERRTEYLNDLADSPLTTVDATRMIITLNNVSISYYQVASPYYRDFNSCSKSIKTMVKIVKGFFEEDYTGQLWLTCQGQRTTGEGYHSQAMVLFYDQHGDLNCLVEDNSDFASEPLPSMLEFMAFMDVDKIGLAGRWGTFFGRGFIDACFVYSHITVHNSLMSQEIVPEQFYHYGSFRQYYIEYNRKNVPLPPYEQMNFPEINY